MEYLVLVGNWALPVLAGVVSILIIALIRKYLPKLGIERSERIDAMIDKYVKIGVGAAERAGQAYLSAEQKKLPGENKKAHAVKVVLDELEQSGIKNVGEQLITARIEAWLQDTDPKQSTGET